MNKHDIENISGCCEQFRKNVYLGKYDETFKSGAIIVLALFIVVGLYLIN